MITDEQLSEWERWADAATSGPWEDTWNVDYHENISWTRYSAWGQGPLISGKSLDEVKLQARKDASFISAARTALPVLIAEVRKLRSLLDDERERRDNRGRQIDELRQMMGVALVERDSAEQQVAKYRAALEIYANKSNWEIITEYGPYGGYDVYTWAGDNIQPWEISLDIMTGDTE